MTINWDTLQDKACLECLCSFEMTMKYSDLSKLTSKLIPCRGSTRIQGKLISARWNKSRIAFATKFSPAFQGGDSYELAETRVWRGLGTWQVGSRAQASHPCTLLLLTGVTLAFCERIWMSSISSATREELSPCDQFQCCQQATEMLEADGQSTPLPFPASAFIVQSWWRPLSINHQPNHTHVGRKQRFVFSQFF